MKELLIILLLFANLLCIGQVPEDYSATQTLSKVDLSGDSILNVVLHDAAKRMVEESLPSYFSVTMNEYKGGNLVKVVKSKADAYEQRSAWEGYVDVNGQIFVIDFGISAFRPFFAYPSETLTIQLTRFKDDSHIQDIRYYYILDDIFAYYSPEHGWIWSDGKPDE